MPNALKRPRAFLHALYFGHTDTARQFRYGLVIFDLATIAVFLIASFYVDAWWVIPLDLALAALLTLELVARLYASTNWQRQLRSGLTIIDVIVIISLLLPALIENLGFLRVARALRILRSYHLLKDLRQDSAWFSKNEDIIQRALNLTAFVFIVASIVFVTQRGLNPKIVTYLDALYFTITALSTTGFGDITLEGTGGRLLSIFIMVIGVSLFLRLLQAIFRPHKVRFECADCGLLLHDADAVHCKHCGRVLRIRDEGQV